MDLIKREENKIRALDKALEKINYNILYYNEIVYI